MTSVNNILIAVIPLTAVVNFIAEPFCALTIHLQEKTVSKAYVKMTTYQIGEEDMPFKNGSTLVSKAIATDRAAVLI